MNQFEKEQRFSAVHAIVYLAHFYVGDDGYTRITEIPKDLIYKSPLYDVFDESFLTAHINDFCRIHKRIPKSKKEIGKTYLIIQKIYDVDDDSINLHGTYPDYENILIFEYSPLNKYIFDWRIELSGYRKRNHGITKINKYIYE